MVSFYHLLGRPELLILINYQKCILVDLFTKLPSRRFSAPPSAATHLSVMSVQRFSLSKLRRCSRNLPKISFLHTVTSSDSHTKSSNPSNSYHRHNHGHRRHLHFLNSLLPSQPLLAGTHCVSFCRSFSTRGWRVGDIGDSVMTQYENTELSLIGENVSGSVEDSILPVRALISLLDGYHDLTGFPW